MVANSSLACGRHRQLHTQKHWWQRRPRPPARRRLSALVILAVGLALGVSAPALAATPGEPGRSPTGSSPRPDPAPSPQPPAPPPPAPAPPPPAPAPPPSPAEATPPPTKKKPANKKPGKKSTEAALPEESRRSIGAVTSLPTGGLASDEPASEVPGRETPGSAPVAPAVVASSDTSTLAESDQEAALHTRPLPSEIITVQPPAGQTTAGDRYVLRAVALGVLGGAVLLLAVAVMPPRSARSRTAPRPRGRAMLVATGLGGVIGVLIGLLGGLGL